MNPEQDRTIPFFLGAVYQSLAMPLEMHFNDSGIAFGVFGGIDHASGQILVRNFCRAGAEVLEPQKVINLSEVRCFIVRETNPRLRGVKGPEGRAAGSPITPGSSLADKARAKPVNGVGKETGDAKPVPEKPRGIQNDEFRTDTEISKRTAESKATPATAGKSDAKVFKRFTADTTLKEEALDMKGGAMGDWDQFKANKDAFGIHSHFDENDYTTHLDIRKASKADLERAERLAREIEGTALADVAHTRHWQEERGLLKLKDNDEDEEALYSAVVREVPMEEAVVVKETREAKDDPKKIVFGLRKTDPEKSKGFREALTRNLKTTKAPAKEVAAAQPPQSNLVSQLSQSTAQTPQVGMPFYGMPGYGQPVMYPPGSMGMGYQQQFAYYPQGVYYQYGYPQQMYQQPGYYQQPPKAP